MGLLEITPLLKGLSELGVAKSHLFQASRELLLLFRSLIKVADESIGAPASPNAQSIKLLLGAVRKTVESLVQQIPPSQDKNFDTIYRSVLESIVDVLAAEIETALPTTPKGRVKREALESIQNLLQKELRLKHDTAA